ncbi:aminotransferase class IV [Saccharothrix algeriensis]|uniref:Aminotransferase class IV n=1 Tax=Saccharothrix algeriensis TaxID=173560 RepID=A0A8T8HZ80_9PSEU|nr:aminotransferase class IV [Saccharothrix algeriensis]MBM7809461.1 branched-subunit amino acid aminotransferase/4-amino-4-deoxychorismate lyase [Saccharothrix algeriensis]QTR03796.1 aminotransferase class IV [Saccharothrix algeriensis]
MLRIEIDGGPATAEQLAPAVLANYGHFTAMQVRDRRVQGLRLHLRRLDAANRELYGAGLDGDRVRALVSHALADDVRDASVRVVVFGPASGSVLVAVRDPAAPADRPQRLLPVDYRRPLPHVKHLGGFGQAHHRNRAQAAGYDEALLTTPDGVVVEGAITNIAFFDAAGVVWADADWLHGITMQLLERALPSRRAVVRLADLRSYRGAFVGNSIGVAPVSRIGDVEYEVDAAAFARVRAALDAVPWDPFE